MVDILKQLGTEQRYALINDAMSLGRSSENDIRIQGSEISKTHCLFERQGHAWTVTDLGSANGTRLNGQLLSPRQKYPLDTSSILQIGATRLQLETGQNEITQQATSFMQSNDAEKIEYLNLKGMQKATIGRNKDNDVVINSPLASRYHAEIQLKQGKALIVDLNSTNGVYINGHRIQGQQWIEPGDKIRIADTKLDLQAGAHGIEQLTKVEEQNHLRFDAIKISKVTADGKRLLNDISFTVKPGEFIAILGGSGAGKSTTLDALNGFRPASSGKVLVNGEDYYQNFAAYQPMLGYVPQSDIIHEALTVYEALDYAAKLRLSGDLSSAERHAQVMKVIGQMGLKERVNVPIRNLSGGQKKRVSIGVELLSEPSLFFLDEPTSGLDPGTERDIMKLMQSLAHEQGKTVFLITHAVGNLDCCDQILFLAMGGQVAYYGPPDKPGKPEMTAHFQKIDPSVKNIPDIYNLMSSQQKADRCVQYFKSSQHYKTYVWDRHQELKSQAINSASQSGERFKAKHSAMRQFLTFSSRYMTIVLKDWKSLLVQFLQTPLIALLIMLAFKWNSFAKDSPYSDRLSAPMLLFMLTCVSIWFGTSNAAQEIIKEIEIYKRERMVNLKILPYLLSKILIQSMTALIQCAVLVLMVCPVFKIAPAFWPGIFGTLYLVSFTGIMLGLAISSLSNSREMAVVIVPLVLIPQIMFSGSITKIDDMSSAGKAVSVLTANRWAYQALGNLTQMNEHLKSDDLPKAERDKPFNRSFNTPLRVNWLSNAIMSLLLFVLALVMLKRKDIR